jgi:IS30 family transposase
VRLSKDFHDERPKIVEEKSHMGDRKGDAIESTGKNACTATFVDRKTKPLPAKILQNKMAALNRAAPRLQVSTRADE